MKTIVKLSAIVLVIFTLMSCGASSYTVSAYPADPVYVRPVQPYPGYVWIDGDWYWSGGRYNYRHGYWAAPRSGYTWHGGNWQHRGNGYTWHRGGWRR